MIYVNIYMFYGLYICTNTNFDIGYNFQVIVMKVHIIKWITSSNTIINHKKLDEE